MTDDIERIEAEADEAYRRLAKPSEFAIKHGLEHLKVTVRLAPGEKCPRCWHYHTVRENRDNLCDRCCLAIIEGWPDHESVPHIKAARARQRAKYEAEWLARNQGSSAKDGH